ncbi:MAG: hypothetical protein HY506_00735 [Candidatus Yanofskybacteria bacterium]|nr:hypothetical protein [Candidatus Yanofskybacteria bacterium]
MRNLIISGICATIYVVYLSWGAVSVVNERRTLYTTAFNRADIDRNGGLDASEVFVAYSIATGDDGEKIFQKFTRDEMRKLIASCNNPEIIKNFVVSWVRKGPTESPEFENYHETPNEFLPRLARFVVDADQDGRVSSTETRDALEVIYPHHELASRLNLSGVGPYVFLKVLFYPPSVADGSELKNYATRR